MSGMIGELVNQRYQIESELGRGGMGVVYRARDALLEREVAFKVLSSLALGTEGRARLLSEARAAAQLNHPNIVTIYDAGETGNSPFIVMELIDGENLYQHKLQAMEEIITVAAQIGTALEHAHTHGIIHRDLKPENVLIASDGTAKLMDFGLARSVASRLTVEGTIAGTVFYLAPELALGQAYDGRADLYALGVMLYELTTGQLPFLADDPLAVITQHLHAPVVPPRAHHPEIPAALNTLIIRLLSKRPDERPASAREVVIALEQMRSPTQLADFQVEIAEELPLLDRLIRGRFIGRGGELSTLRQRWALAETGHGHLVLISGEPGIGKSRLANEIITYARLRGAVVLQGGSYEYESSLPYLPFAEALRDWVRDQPPENLSAKMKQTAPELAKLAPEIEVKIGPLKPNPRLTPEEERLRLFDNVSRFFQELAAEKGLLIFLDDLHWSDQGSLALVHYLLRRLQNDPVLILGAYREVELDRKHPLSTSLVAWNRERLATRIQLDRFTQKECAALLGTMFGQEQVSGEFAAAIYRETEGNPFFIEEVAKALVEQGQIYLQDGEWERKEIHELAIPQSIKEAIGRRLDRLSEACSDALHSAAVLGKDFEFAELVALTDLDEDGLLDVLDEANRAQLVQPKSGEKFIFTHDKIREVLYDELNPIRQRRLHRQICEVIENLYAGKLEDHVSDLAYHAVLGGDLNKGLVYSIQAAENASHIFAHEEALNFYQQARDCAIALNEAEQLAEIEEAMGSVHADRGHSLLAIESFERALSFALSKEKRAYLKNRIGSEYTQIGDERALEYLNAALDELDPETQPNEMAGTLSMMARNHHFRAQYDRSIELLGRALELAEARGDPTTLMNIYGFFSGSLQHLGRYEDSNHWARTTIALGESKEFPAAISIGHEFLSENAFLQGDWKMALYHADQNYRVGEKIGWLARIAWSGFAKLATYRALGNLHAAQSEGRSGLRIAEDIADRRLVVWFESNLSIVETDLGQDETAFSRAENAMDLAQESGEPILISASHMAMSYYHIQREEWEAARSVLDASEVIQSQRQPLLLLSEMWVIYAEALWGSGELDEASELAGRLLEHTRRRGERYPEALATWVKGKIFASQKAWDQALRCFEIAVDAFEQLGSQVGLGRALYQRARLYQALSQQDEALKDASRAVEIFTQVGASRDAHKVEQFLAGKPKA
jgi:tetratricopeptide (TPR) repeat protein/predicted Ser/Thr protein kinase